jgi:hypothetical protein
MGYSHKVARVTIHGTNFNGAEEWTTGFYMGLEGSDALAPTQGFADEVRGYWDTYWKNVTSRFSSQWKYDYIKVATHGTDGKTIPDSVIYSYPTSPVSGGSTSDSFPPQVALVATLISNNQRGLAAKGRMFLPGINANIGADGRLASSNQTDILTNFKTFMSNVNSLQDSPGVIVLASQGRKAPLVGGPANKAVTSVRLGNVYDTQRRRRNQLVEVYQTQPLFGI